MESSDQEKAIQALASIKNSASIDVITSDIRNQIQRNHDMT